MKKEFLTIMEKLNCTEQEYTDLALAICQADVLYGGNRRELSIQRLYASTDAFTKNGLNAGVVSAEPLPRVQLCRVYADVALIVARKHGINLEGEYLTNDYSDKVARLYGAGMNHNGGGYGSEEDCKRIIDKLVEKLVDEKDYEWAVQICKLLNHINKWFESHGYNKFKEYMHDGLHKILIPVDTDYFGKGEAQQNVEQLATDTVNGMLLSLYCNDMFKRYESDYSQAQIVLRFCEKVFEGYLVGADTYKQQNLAVDVTRNMPSYMVKQINRVFDTHKAVTFDDFAYICTIIMLTHMSYSKLIDRDITSKTFAQIKGVLANEIK